MSEQLSMFGNGGGRKRKRGSSGGNGAPPPSEVQAPLHEEARRRYLNYALSVITSRALPDVRDGLKPVQRRIIYGMFQDHRLTHDAKYQKCAKVVGTIMGQYHPHGDVAIPLVNAPRPTIAPPPPGALVHRGDVDRILDEGRSLLDLDPRAAHEIFEKAWRRNLNDPRVLSNYGLTLVLVEGDRQRGIRFCEEALRRGLQTTETLVNMARALVVTRNKEQAVRALRKAMELSPDDPRVSAEFAALGLRRPPPIPWLPRSFFLNKWIGKLTWKLSRRERLDPLAQPEA